MLRKEEVRDTSCPAAEQQAQLAARHTRTAQRSAKACTAQHSAAQRGAAPTRHCEPPRHCRHVPHAVAPRQAVAVGAHGVGGFLRDVLLASQRGAGGGRAGRQGEVLVGSARRVPARGHTRHAPRHPPTPDHSPQQPHRKAQSSPESSVQRTVALPRPGLLPIFPDSRLGQPRKPAPSPPRSHLHRMEQLLLSAPRQQAQAPEKSGKG